MSLMDDAPGGNAGGDWLQGDAPVIKGASMIEAYRLSVLRSALKLEIARPGSRRSNRGRATLTLVNEVMGTGYRRKRAAYEAFDAWLAERGQKSRPLPGKKEDKAG